MADEQEEKEMPYKNPKYTRGGAPYDTDGHFGSSAPNKIKTATCKRRADTPEWPDQATESTSTGATAYDIGKKN